ncbi:protein MKS1-like [Phalaenopsis equestris]|uniref:protein MKS1-like n=1 Tax=Phalaenopsis equestris TaxID=78828 RepID=UPI0009E393DE|nr:protein MKS1-like [Phalaenopsis equestris]
MDLFLNPREKPSLKQKLQLHGPRPSPLQLHKNSHKIIKPYNQRRSPIIIHAVSPKIIHTNPKEFMALVQRLTGFQASAANNNPSSSSSSADSATVDLMPKSYEEALELSSPSLLSPSVLDILSSNLFQESKGFGEAAFLASPGSLFCSL